jgi:hypothetical protein
MAERPGFEPGGQFYPTNRLAGGCLRPLGHLSVQSRFNSSECRSIRPWDLAEGVGFEPTDLSVIPFQAGRLQPLGHPSGP